MIGMHALSHAFPHRAGGYTWSGKALNWPFSSWRFAPPSKLLITRCGTRLPSGF